MNVTSIDFPAVYLMSVFLLKILKHLCEIKSWIYYTAQQTFTFFSIVCANYAVFYETGYAN
jgi:hypothetical protein